MKEETSVLNLCPREPNEISIVMSCDDNYAMYTSVAIQSIIEHTIVGHYTIYILNEGLTENTQDDLLSMATNRVHIKCINVKKYIQQYPRELFYTHSHYSMAIYYRLFISDIFKQFKKVIYCDVDAVFCTDPAWLYKQDLEGKLIAAVKDPGIVYEISRGSTYFAKELQLKNPYNYFQSGILLFNIPFMLQFDFTHKCFEVLKKLKTPKLPDQDVMNIVCEERVLFLDASWNVLSNMLHWYPDFAQKVPQSVFTAYVHALQNPNFLHFGGKDKPWIDICLPKAKTWWQYAKKTPFYEQILAKFLDILDQKKRNYPGLYRQYIRCRFLEKITWGKRRLHYQEKTVRLLKQLRHIEPFL